MAQPVLEQRPVPPPDSPELVPAPAEPRGWRERFRAFRARHARLQALAFFLAGFLFDAAMVQRIDDAPMLIQQGAYLILVGILLAIGFRMEHRRLEAPRLLRPVWKWSDHAVHFMLGTLLNAYMLFYVKSASGLAAFLFLVVIGGLLAVNEMPRFHKYGPLVLIGLYSFCLTSYFAYLFPVLLGRLRPWMFALAVATSLFPLFALVQGVRRWSGALRPAVRHVAVPAGLVQGLLLALFLVRLIPPVPLSVRRMGIYHGVERDAQRSEYLLSREGKGWRFWRSDDREFHARPGDRIYCFVRIFAPRNFQDRVLMRWSYKDPMRGWLPGGAVPMNIVGGREEGFRGFTYKSRYTPGEWRVSVETEDEREIGALRFSVEDDPSLEPRELVVERD